MFWDSSALVPLLVPEDSSASLTRHIRSDSTPTIWWASPVECRSAIHRRHREGVVSDALLGEALRRLTRLIEAVDAVAATEEVRGRAGHMLATHPLRAADALQLAAALSWCEGSTAGQSFVCLDRRLRDAAGREGFALLPAH
jgi:predicted nucleic acid-binding protein